MLRTLRILLFPALVASACGARPSPIGGGAPPCGCVSSDLPESIDPDARYVIYLHNLWREGHGPDEPHPEFGLYEREAILDGFAAAGLQVVAEVRPAGCEATAYARHVAGQVRALLDAGVPADAITVVGFSRGGAIAILASSAIGHDDVRFVLLAACDDWVEEEVSLEPRGRMLAITEASDTLATSCNGLFRRLPEGSGSREIRIDVGGGHGAFFRPLPEWTSPTIDWALGGD